MNSQWEYTNTKIAREFNPQNYSNHLNDMGSQGWELVTVDTYADQGFNLLYWKRRSGSKNVSKIEGYSVGKDEKIDKDLKVKKDTSNVERIQTSSPIVAPNAPKPVFASIVRYVIQDGFMDKMLEEICDGPSLEAVAQYTLQISASEIVNVTMVPALDDMITKEETGVNWLDTVEHMLVKFSNGSRTDACSGAILFDWHNGFNEGQLQNKTKVLSAVKYRVKEGCVDEFLSAVMTPSEIPMKIRKTIIQTDEQEFYELGIAGLEEKIETEDEEVKWLDTVEHLLEFFGDSRTQAYSGVVSIWNNPKSLDG
ncbi:hypothetical protein GN286_17405 [Rhodobacteraceae bacterium IMCC15231]|nr:hypothetical protein [Rhodobacteraceae bacterium IMCC15231]